MLVVVYCTVPRTPDVDSCDVTHCRISRLSLVAEVTRSDSTRLSVRGRLAPGNESDLDSVSVTYSWLEDSPAGEAAIDSRALQ